MTKIRYFTTGGNGAGATTALDNLASVAINTSLISDTDSTDDLGSSTVAWANAYIDSIYIANTQSQTDVRITGFDDGSTRNQGIYIENDKGYAYLILKGDIAGGSDAGQIYFESADYTKAAGNAAYISYFADDMSIFSKGDLDLFGSKIDFNEGASSKFILDANILYPTSDSAIDLGKSTNYWSDLFIDKIFLNATATLDGATAGHIKFVGDLVPATDDTEWVGEIGSPFKAIKGLILKDTTDGKHYSITVVNGTVTATALD